MSVHIGSIDSVVNVETASAVLDETASPVTNDREGMIINGTPCPPYWGDGQQVVNHFLNNFGIIKENKNLLKYTCDYKLPHYNVIPFSYKKGKKRHN